MVPSNLAGLEIFCGVCNERVFDHRAHIASALHDEFVVRLADGSTTPVGDLGASQELADQEDRERVAAQQENEAHFQWWGEEAARRLAGAGESLEQTKQAIARQSSEIISLEQTIRAIDREQPRLEQRVRDAEQAVEEARRQARAEVDTWRTESICLPGVSATQEARIRGRCAETHWSVYGPHRVAAAARSSLWDARERRSKLARQLLEWLAHRQQLEEGLPAKEQELQRAQEFVRWHQDETIRQLQKSVMPATDPRKEPSFFGVPGLALRKAKLARAWQEI